MGVWVDRRQGGSNERTVVINGSAGFDEIVMILQARKVLGN